MKLQTEVLFPSFNTRLHIGDPLLLIGSCFSVEMAPFFTQSGFHVLSNPFGVLFHPEALVTALRSCIQESQELRVTQRDDLFFDWDSSGEIWSFDLNELKQNVLSRRKEVRQLLSKENALLVFTFGTAFAYRLKEDQQIVANCHKQPAQLFEKALITVDEMKTSFLALIHELKAFNPSLRFMSTVSPVRHSKDGFRENAISKGRLLELCSALEVGGVEYIPTYEYVIDDLRDYRFYEKDGLHPNALAREMIWKQLKMKLIAESDQANCAEIERFFSASKHRSLQENSKEDLKFREQLASWKMELEKRFPSIQFE